MSWATFYARIKEELVRLDTRRCTIETEGFGTMVFELYPEYAPITVESFKKLSDEGSYDGLCWCRIVKDYVIQGGSGPTISWPSATGISKGNFWKTVWIIP